MNAYALTFFHKILPTVCDDSFFERYVHAACFDST